VPRGARTTFNTTLATLQTLEAWFVEMYWLDGANATRARDVIQTLEAQARIWRGVKKKVRGRHTAPDLGENEIVIIDNFLWGRTDGHRRCSAERC
jgi:hypothetical protein